MSTAPDYLRWFDRLDHLLSQYRHLWQIQAFYHRQLVWQHSLPSLCSALQSLTDAQRVELETNTEQLGDWLSPWLGEDARELISLAQLEVIPPQTSVQTSAPQSAAEASALARLDTHIPGRKWQQIQAFANTLSPSDSPVLEWCAGKGHLGRLIAVTHARPVTSLEWQAELCQQGQQLADQCNAQLRFVQADALASDSGHWLTNTGQAVALHACGQLHTRLMQHWVNSNCQRLTLSPCCYHVITGDTYQPLSQRAQCSEITLSKQNLQLPLQETVTASLGVQRKRTVEVLWRLSFDEWQRHARGVDEYLPLPAVQKSLLSDSFTRFCQWACEKKGLPIPIEIEEHYWLERGEQRVKQVNLMELVSHFFRRPLEVWLALDRVLFLQEHGAQVQLGLFCDKPLTPRNILINAEKSRIQGS